MKKMILIILLSLLIIEGVAQNRVVTGRITLFNRNSENLYGISVYADDAPSVVTTPGGFFTLEFSTKKAGSKITIVVDKKGWIVLNNEETVTRIPDSPSEQIDEITLCRSEDYNEAIKTLQFYQELQKNAKKEFEIDRIRLEKKIKNADSDAAAAKEELVALKAKYELQKKINEEISRELNSSKSSSISLEALVEENFIKYHNLDSALNVLDDHTIDNIFKNAKQELDKTGLILANNNYILKAQLYISKSELKKAEKYFLKAYENDSQNIKLLEELGNFYILQNETEKAIELYKKALANCSSDKEKAYILNVLSTLYLSVLETDKSVELLDQSIGLYTNLAKVNEDKYMPFVASQLMLKKALYTSNASSDNLSRFNCNDIFEKLVKIDSSRYLYYSIIAKIQSGFTKKTDDTTLYYLDVINSLNKVQNKSLESFQLLHAYTGLLECFELARIGNATKRRNQLDSVLKELTLINFPVDYSTNLTTIIPNMEEVEPLEVKLSDPVTYIPMYSGVLQTATQMYIGLNMFSNKDKVVGLYEKLETELRKAFNLNPDRYKGLLVMNIGTLAVAYSANHNFKKAFALSEESLNLSDEMIKQKDLDGYRYLKAIQLINASSVCFYSLVYQDSNKGIKRKGKNDVKDAIRILKTLKRKNKINTKIFQTNIRVAKRQKKQFHKIWLARLVLN